MKKLISTGSPMEKQAGYSRAVVKGDWVFVSGTTGYDYENMVMPQSFAEQTHNCFKTISETLEKADASLSDIVRVNYVIAKREYAEEAFEIFGQYFGNIRPAAMLIVAGMLTDDMKIEIEVTALRG